MLVAGCSSKPCATSNDCGSGEVCAAERCQALSCEQTFSAIDPADGKCKPIGACAVDDSTRGWTTCADPCLGLGEFACVKDPRCQPVYVGAAQITPVACANAGGGLNPGGPDCTPGSASRTFNGCRANPVGPTPCANLDQTACAADARCAVEQIGVGSCLCAAGDPNCQCRDPGATFECRDKTCLDFSAVECLTHAECTTNGLPVCNCPPNADCACPTGGTGAPPPAPGFPAPPSFAGSPDPVLGCFPRFHGCSDMDEPTCLAHPECHPVGTPCYCPPGAQCFCSGGAFVSCEGDDGLSRCDTDTDCDGDQRCNNDEQCAPPNGGVVPTPFGGASGGASGAPVPQSTPAGPGCAGLCVPKGCKGYGEIKCNADPSCEAIYELQCSPYGGGGFEGGPGVACGGVQPAGGPAVSCGGCEPSFVSCTDGSVSGGVVPEKSVLVREPDVVDDPAFAFSRVMSGLAGGQDVNAFVTRWLAQLGVATTANGRVAAARTGAADYLASLPHLADGNLDVANLGFQTTSLSNRLDLAGPHDCGEARITYALAGGLTDRRHRMTVIVELRQPDDGARCQTVGGRWVALSSLSGADLAHALGQIYAPLLTPATLNQVRTNEFLVGPQTPNPGAPPDPSSAWELREWRLGADGNLQLSPSKQAIDPSVVNDPTFQSWALANSDALIAHEARLPDAFLAITSSENGSRVFAPFDPTGDLTTALNQVACAGCHTTESNTAFVHVAERFGGTGQALISKFLETQLPGRTGHLSTVAKGGLTTAARNLLHLTH
jgi:hypothetical protein